MSKICLALVALLPLYVTSCVKPSDENAINFLQNEQGFKDVSIEGLANPTNGCKRYGRTWKGKAGKEDVEGFICTDTVIWTWGVKSMK